MTTTDFHAFGLAAPLMTGLEEAGFTDPTPIQARAIAPQLAGRDLLGIAQTGTGKTAAFGLPLLHELVGTPGRPRAGTTRALILAPTRELAVQIEETLRALRGPARVSTLLVLGGTSRGAQIRALSRGVDCVVATPGRLTDLMRDGHLRLGDTRTLILDEADRMLDMGFIKPVREIARKLHAERRTALFSATMPAEIERLAAELLHAPERVEVAAPGTSLPKIAQAVEMLPQGEKRARLASVASHPEAGRVIVFARTKRGADRVAENLARDGVEAAAIHGNKAQNARQRALKDFAAGRVRVLVATDIAARGIDVADISHVVQFDLPDEPEAYVHRIGRTGRNGAEGQAIAFCTPEERGTKLRAIEKLLRRPLIEDGHGHVRPGDTPGAEAKGGARSRARRRRAPRRRAAA